MYAKVGPKVMPLILSLTSSTAYIENKILQLDSAGFSCKKPPPLPGAQKKVQQNICPESGIVHRCQDEGA